MLDHSTPILWILSQRSEELTSLIKLTPFLVSDTFLMIFIAIGFWRKKHPLFFLDLIFLVSLTTIANNGLKGFFAIPRPDIHFHLIPISDSWGFPSGDVQLATVFWAALWFYFRNYLTGLLMIIVIPTVMFSRLYLGVHSGYDVLGGLFCGIIILVLYLTITKTSFLTTYFLENKKIYWVTVFLILIFYVLLNQHGPIPPMVPLALGAFIGYGVSLSHLDLSPKPFDTSGKEITFYLIALMAIVAFSKFFPSLPSHPLFIRYLLMMIKIALFVWGVLIAIPWIFDKISLRFWKKSPTI